MAEGSAADPAEDSAADPAEGSAADPAMAEGSAADPAEDSAADPAMAEGSAADPATAEGNAADPAEDSAADPAEDGATTLAEVCVVACAEAWRGDGAILASPMGLIPTLGAKLAQLTFAPDLLITDGEATLLAPGDTGPLTEGWLPYRLVFTMLAAGKRHVMMGAAQLDRFGNQNISCIGDWARPKAQLLGVRGAPGNTINHPVSYWVPRHSRRVFAERADMVCGIGYDRAAALGQPAARFHELRVVVTNLAVLDFGGPEHAMRIRSVHPGVSAGDVIAATGFPLAVPGEVPVTRLPTPGELALIRDRLDPAGRRDGELS